MGTRLAVAVSLFTFSILVAACGDNRAYEPDAADCTPVDDGNECTDDICTADGQPLNQPKDEGAACGAGVCDADGDCVECLADDDCTSPEVCDEASNACVAVTCTDGEQNGDETDVDCGGSCAPGRRCGDTLGCGLPGDCQSGVCTADVCQAPACGDGVRQGSEACDDGNHTNGDGCDDGSGGTCRPTGCGNGTVAGTEVCDDGNTTDGDGCDNNCTTTACGNGVITGSETCDDADATPGDGCSATCTIEPGFTCTMVPSVCVATCGNGVVTAGEACDDAPPAENGDGCSMTCTIEPGFTCTGSPSVCVTACGDGVRAPGEGCDDGDTMAGDGCNAACFVEPGWVCAGMPSACFPICGDGRVVPTEACDDPAPAENGDGCSATCTVEIGYTCAGSPSSCGPICGDGLVFPGEACDDPAPAEAGDGCSATCTVESGWTCSGAPSACVTTCGDGILAGTEACDDPSPAEAGDGCSLTCTVEPGYTCSGSPSACTAVCGDGLVTGTEPCDDAPPAEDGDGCSAVCTVEPGYNCQGSPSTCLLTCGNGVLDAGEGCDDSGLVDNDGCSAACTIETGYTCVGTPSVCTTTCGDGVRGGLEQCDDAPPNESGDGCSATCTIELGYTCTGTPSVCATTCGDGITAGAETCDDSCNAGTPGLCEPADDNDGCSSTCALECGNGVLDVALEQCDDGNRTSGDRCSSTCTVEIACSAGEVAMVVANNVSTQLLDGNTTGLQVSVSIPTAGAVSKAIVFISSLTHPQADNIDLYLIGPTGLSRELSTDNGSTGDNYLQTYFDDNAPGTPPTTATAPPFTGRFRPETSLSTTAGTDFTGTRSAGTWNLRVADDLATNTGTLDGWVLGLCVRPAQPYCGDGVRNGTEECDDGNVVGTDVCSNSCTITDGCGDGNLDAGEACDDDNAVSGDGCGPTCQVEITCAPGETPVLLTNSTSLPIPDNSPGGVLSPVDVTATGGVTRAMVFIGNLTHTWDSDVNMFLTSPAGIERELSTGNGSSGDNYVRTFLDDGAATAITSGSAPFTGRFRPEQSLASTNGVDLRGTAATGTWNLRVFDSGAGDTGTLNSWTLGLCVNPLAVCGDGVINGTEECDDANANDTDACNNRCGLTDGCGDGNLDGGEACDDDNTIAGDGCSPSCTLDIGCGPGETAVIATSTSPIVMPDSDIGGAVGTLEVLTAGLVRRVIVTVNMDHTAVGQTTLRLSSPYGTDRDLTSGNGGLGDNLRATTFSDSASSPITAIAAAGAPFTGTFRPEETISTAAGFANQSAAGHWALRAFDSSTAETGSVTSWSVQLCVDTAAVSVCGNGFVEANETCDDANTSSFDGCSATCQAELSCALGQATVFVRATDLPRVFRDNDPAGASSIININTTRTVRRTVVIVGAISHRFLGDVDLTLTGPSGGPLDLSSDNGSGGDHYAATMLDDTATVPISSAPTVGPLRGHFRPETALSALNGTGAGGNWTLKVVDDAGGDAGLLSSWILGLCVE